MIYDEAMKFIKDTEKLGSVPGLDNITALMNLLGNPQDKLKIIHVAGTNGKGSTISFLSNILARAGYRVGMFISPVVFSYNEKLQILSKVSYNNDVNYGYIGNCESTRESIDTKNTTGYFTGSIDADENTTGSIDVDKNNTGFVDADEYTTKSIDTDKNTTGYIDADENTTGYINNDKNEDNHRNRFKEDNCDNDDLIYCEYISREDIINIIDVIKPACEDMVRRGQDHPTAFEIETAMAFLYMAYKQVDFLVLETGMGGRLDSTNVIRNPICSIITSVSYDHVNFLGNTLEQIAYEKAGIMKPDSFAVTCNQKHEVISTLQIKASELKIPLCIGDSNKATNIGYYENYTEFEYPSVSKYEKENYKIQLLGNHQIKNAILAIETVRMMNKYGYLVDEDAIKRGLWQSKWHGRFEKISSNPDIYIDGAHNEEAALKLRDSIEIYFTNRRLIFMIGVLADKDYQSMLSILAPLADVIITLTSDNNRALPSDRLAEEARKYCNRVFDGKDIDNAIKMAYKEAGPEDVIIAFGSLSFLGGLARDLIIRKDERNG